MKQANRKLLCLMLAVAIAVGAAAPVFAEATPGTSTPGDTGYVQEVTGISEPTLGEGEPRPGDSLPAGELPAVNSEPEVVEVLEEPRPPVLTGDTELLHTLPITRLSEDGEPLLGGIEDVWLTLSVNYPSGKSALKTGDIVKLVVGLSYAAGEESLYGESTVNSMQVQKGIGAFALAVTYNNAFTYDSNSTSLPFTSKTSPKAGVAELHNSNETLRLVSLFSEKVGSTVQALNSEALGKTNRIIAVVGLKLDGTISTGSIPGAFQAEGVFAFVKDNAETEERAVQSTGGVSVDINAPLITVADLYNDNQSAETIAPKNVVGTTMSVSPGALVSVTDDGAFAMLVKKGNAAVAFADEDEATPGTQFTLTDPATYTITVTDTAGNISTGKVTVAPRITGISLAVTGATGMNSLDDAGTVLGTFYYGYIGDVITVTPTLSPSVSLLPANDKKLYWKLSPAPGSPISPEEVTSSLGSPAEQEGSLIWEQQIAGRVTFTVKRAAKSEFYITAYSGEKLPGTIDTPRAASNQLGITIYQKVKSITVTASQSTLASLSGGVESAEIKGAIITQGPVIDSGTPSLEDFIGCGGFEAITGNQALGVVKPDTLVFDTPTVKGNDYSYPYRFTVEAKAGATGVCDVYVLCGLVKSAVALNITNYPPAYTKMTLTQTTSGLDPVKNTTDELSISLTNPKNSSQAAQVLPADCTYTVSNSSLLQVIGTSGARAKIAAGEGAKYLAAAAKVTVTAALKNDPLNRKATATYTIYPTERADGIVITGMEEAAGVEKITDEHSAFTGVYTSTVGAQAQLITRITGQQVLGASAFISSANKKLVKFTSTNAKVATVSDTGLIAVKGYGECEIKVAATDGSNYTASVRVVAHKPIQTLLAAAPDTMTITPGGMVKLSLSGVYPADAANAKRTGLSWSVAGDTDGFTFNQAKGELTAKNGALVPDAGETVTVTASVPDLSFDEVSGTLTQTTVVKEFTVVAAVPDAAQLSAFKALAYEGKAVKAIEATANAPFTISVADAKFIEESAQWSLIWADGSAEAAQTGTQATYSLDKSGKATVYANYGGKTLSVPVTVYQTDLPGSASVLLNDSGTYSVYDRYTTDILKPQIKNGTTVTDASPDLFNFTSSHPALVYVASNGAIGVLNFTAMKNLTADTKVTITAALKDDPKGRKVSKVITVTPKILPVTITSLNAYNQRFKTFFPTNNTFSLSAYPDKTLNLVVKQNLRDETENQLYLPKQAAEFYENGTTTSAYAGSDEHAWAMAGLAFISSNTRVATVDKNGVVTLKGATGDVTITATQAAGTYPKGQAPVSCALQLKVLTYATNITLDRYAYSIVAGNTADVSVTLKATVTPAGAMDGKVTWVSTNDAVATVDENGKVTVKAGRIAGEEAEISAYVNYEGDDKNRLYATCKIVVGGADSVLSKFSTLSTAEKKLTVGMDNAGFYFIANDLNNLHAVSNNSPVLEIGEKSLVGTVNGKSYYKLAVTPKAPGTATVTIVQGSKTYAETFTVYAYDPALTKLMPKASTGLLLDSTNGYNAFSSEMITADLLDKSNAAGVENIGEDRLTYTSSNPALLLVNDDGSYYVRNLSTIKSVTTVHVTVALKNDPARRNARLSFKITPSVAAVQSLSIGALNAGADYFKSGITLLDGTLNQKVLLTDIGDAGKLKVFNLAATLKKTDNTTVTYADKALVTWKSSNTKVAVVDAGGVLTVKAKGTAAVTATAKDGSAVYDTVTVRANQGVIITTDIPRKAYGETGSPQTIEILAGGSYTIPIKTSSAAGDMVLDPNTPYRVSGGGVLSVDKKGKVTAPKGASAGSGSVTVTYVSNQIYKIESGTEQLDTGAVKTEIVIPFQLLAAASVKSLSLVNEKGSSITKLDVWANGAEVPLTLKGAANNGSTPDYSQAVVSVQAMSINSAAEASPLRARVVGNSLLITPGNAPGTYQLTVSLGGKTTTCRVNALPSYQLGGGVIPISSGVKLSGKVVSESGEVLQKLYPADEGASLWIGAANGDAIACSLFSFTSSSALVSVNHAGELVAAPYIPKETKVTITAVLKNDPLNRKVSIPVTVTPQRLTRDISLYAGTTKLPPNGVIYPGYANKSTVRLSAVSVDALGGTPDNTAVTWKSSNTKVVTVDKNGVIKLNGSGTATVTATAADGGGAMQTVNVNVY